MSSTVQANDGTMLPVDSLPVVIGYAGQLPTTFTWTYQGNTYVQTLTYSGNNVINISGYEVQ
jgi:hypothetical protein